MKTTTTRPTLPEEEERRFFRIWWPLLRFVNEKRRLVPDWPKEPGPGGVVPADADKIRGALWHDDALRESFIAANPAGLSERDLRIVASWKRRLGKSFLVVRHLKGHSLFLDEGPPPRSYGVCGLHDPIEEVVGSRLPVAVEAVLLASKSLTHMENGTCPSVVWYRLSSIGLSLIV